MPLSAESPPAAVGCGDGIMLFGVRMNVVDPMRKSVSMNNLSEYEPVSNTSNLGKELTEAEKEVGGGGGYASANDAVAQPSGGRADRKRGTPWTEEEHKLFLIGLQKVGKGDWKGISRNYVKTRTPTQVASHAQKYFIRLSSISRRRRRSSLFDMTTDSVSAMPMEEAKNSGVIPAEPVTQPAPVTSNAYVFSAMPFPVTIAPVMLSMQGGNPTIGQNFLMNNSSPMLVHHLPFISMPPPSSAMANLKLNQQVPRGPSLGLSLSIGKNQSSSRGESIVSVA